MRTLRLLGVEFADLELNEAVRWVLARPIDAPFDYVVTPNADHLVRLSRDAPLAAIYRDAALRLLDFRVVARAARAIGMAAPRVVTGSDLTARLLACLPEAERVTIVGLRPAWLPGLVARTGIAPPAHLDPPMGFERDPASVAAAVRFVLDHPARCVFLAVGSPRQEVLAAAIKASGCHRSGTMHRRQPRVHCRCHAARRVGCRRRDWNGCTALSAIPAGWGGGTFWTIR